MIVRHVLLIGREIDFKYCKWVPKGTVSTVCIEALLAFSSLAKIWRRGELLMRVFHTKTTKNKWCSQINKYEIYKPQGLIILWFLWDLSKGTTSMASYPVVCICKMISIWIIWTYLYFILFFIIWNIFCRAWKSIFFFFYSNFFRQHVVIS